MKPFIPTQAIGWPFERANDAVALLARRINREYDLPALVRVRPQADDGQIDLVFGWRNTDSSQNREIQGAIMHFATNGFSEKVRPILKDKLGWKRFGVNRGCQRGKTSFVVILKRIN